VIVVGGGPAGAATSISLARFGVAATVLEAAPGPRCKVGESLPPSANPVLERLGLIPGLRRAALPSYGSCSRWGSEEPTERDFLFAPTGVGWRVDRRAFELELAAAARETGVHWRYDHRVVACRRRTPRGWTLHVVTAEGPQTVSADLVVDASGRAARLARLLGVRRVRYDRLIGTVFYCSTRTPAGPSLTFDPPADDSTTVIEAVPDGWWYSLFLPSRRLIAAFLTDGDLLDDVGIRPWNDPSAHFAHAPTTRSRLLTADDPKRWDGPHIRPAHTSRLNAITGPDWLAVGDAAVTFDPLASYGISSALGAGFYAAASVVEHLGGRLDALRAYAELVDHTFAQYLILCHERYTLERRWPDATFWRRRHRPLRPEAAAVAPRPALGPAT
jgi:flavin-dependent dehydrogenase